MAVVVEEEEEEEDVPGGGILHRVERGLENRDILFHFRGDLSAFVVNFVLFHNQELVEKMVAIGYYLGR